MYVQLIVSIAVLAAYVVAVVAVKLRLNYLRHRRAQRAQLRRVARYRVERDLRPGNVVSLDTFSRRVDAA